MVRHATNMRPRTTASRSHQRGTAAVEFALMLPVFATLLFGVVEFSFGIYNKAVITNASREAARAGVVYAKPRLTPNQISAVASNYASNMLVTFGTNNPPVITVDQSEGTAAGRPLKVTVSYTYSGLMLSSVLSQFTGPFDLTAATTMAYE
jgi:Flp pilus assembly protein TadG